MFSKLFSLDENLKPLNYLNTLTLSTPDISGTTQTEPSIISNTV